MAHFISEWWVKKSTHGTNKRIPAFLHRECLHRVWLSPIGINCFDLKASLCRTFALNFHVQWEKALMFCYKIIYYYELGLYDYNFLFFVRKSGIHVLNMKCEHLVHPLRKKILVHFSESSSKHPFSSKSRIILIPSWLFQISFERNVIFTIFT